MRKEAVNIFFMCEYNAVQRESHSMIPSIIFNQHDEFIYYYMWSSCTKCLAGELSLTDYEPSLLAKSFIGSGDGDGSSSGSSRSLSPPIFVLCERCHWSATYFDKTKVPKDNNCPECNDNNDNDNTELTSFPILSNESFTFHYSDKTGVELEFKPRRKGS